MVTLLQSQLCRESASNGKLLQILYKLMEEVPNYCRPDSDPFQENVTMRE